MQLTKITLPDLHLRPADAPKIRGYFANVWREHSDLLHNHTPDGKSIYRYPKVQYKVIRGVPTLIGIDEGGDLLIRMFLQLEELRVGEKVFPLRHKEIKNRQVEVGLTEERHRYRFVTPWMPLNQRNHPIYEKADEAEQARMLKGTLRNNMFAFFSSVGIRIQGDLQPELDISRQLDTKFKRVGMTAFKGRFTVNALLPDFIGLGKSTARGYGTFKKVR